MNTCEGCHKTFNRKYGLQRHQGTCHILALRELQNRIIDLEQEKQQLSQEMDRIVILE